MMQQAQNIQKKLKDVQQELSNAEVSGESFGGAVKVVKQNIINDILQNDPLTSKEIVIEHVAQDENSLVCKKDLIITINIDDYPLKKDLEYDEVSSVLHAKGSVAKVESADKIFSDFK